MATKNKAIDDELKRLLIDCIYTGRGHQTAGQCWAEVHTYLGIPATVLAAVAGVGSAASAIDENKWLAAGLAVLSVVFTSASEFIRPEERSNAHLEKGRHYLSLRDDVRVIRNISMQSNPTLDSSEKTIKAFRARYSELGKMEPLNIPRWAYERAKTSIENGESDYENDSLWEKLG